MATIDNPGSSGPHSSFNTGDRTVKEKEEVQQRSPKEKEDIANVPLNHTQAPDAKDKGVQYLVLSVVGYVCASIVFGFLLNKRGKDNST